MTEKVKKLLGTTIEIRKNSIKFIPEDKTYPWWRKRLDRQKDALLFPEICEHMKKIATNVSRINDKGQLVSKYNLVMTNLPPNPKSSQGNMKTKYKKKLISCLKKNSEELDKFKDKEVFLYVAIYLRSEKYSTYDTDNFLKAIIDSLKEFIGDDNKVASIFVNKLELKSYPKEDLDFLEQVLIVVSDLKARVDILKGIC